jgi:hypothetical protein
MPGNKSDKSDTTKVSKKEFNRQVALAVRKHFRGGDSDGKLVVTGEQIVDNLRKALVTLGDPLDYRVSLELLGMFGFVSETLGLAYFAERAVRLPSGLRVLFSQLLFCLVHVT